MDAALGRAWATGDEEVRDLLAFAVVGDPFWMQRLRPDHERAVGPVIRAAHPNV